MAQLTYEEKIMLRELIEAQLRKDPPITPMTKSEYLQILRKLNIFSKYL